MKVELIFPRGVITKPFWSAPRAAAPGPMYLGE